MTTTERLKSFCAKPIDGSLKPYLDRPLRFSGTLWASNGHILIACPDDPAVEAQDIPEAAQIQSFERQYSDHWDFSPLPPIDEPEACVFCHGKRRGHECHTCPHLHADHCDDVDGCFGYGERCADLSASVSGLGFCYEFGQLWSSYREWMEMQNRGVMAAPKRYRPMRRGRRP